MLESFGESPKAWVTNSSRPPANFKGKENPDLPSVCSNYWPPNVALSLYFNHLVLLTFRLEINHVIHEPKTNTDVEQPSPLYYVKHCLW